MESFWGRPLCIILEESPRQILSWTIGIFLYFEHPFIANYVHLVWSKNMSLGWIPRKSLYLLSHSMFPFNMGESFTYINWFSDIKIPLGTIGECLGVVYPCFWTCGHWICCGGLSQWEINMNIYWKRWGWWIGWDINFVCRGGLLIF